MLNLKEAPVVRTSMLIRRPVEEVFQAIVDPEVTTKFWFTKSSGRLDNGKHVTWEWEMYGVAGDVEVLDVEDNQRIVLAWPTKVEWNFQQISEQETFVTVINSGFEGEGDDIVQEAIDSMGGFTMVLCAMKALLEHGIILTVVADKAPPK
ncbi:SRPBCC family protein [Paenibacillus sp. JCM 10914]|uniref:SRPBCC family protein n=1 Tax=Paenibacillus sp. JCM 10914 TaxID=1236974 RepID=UPI0005617462|nr:SRPBCC family protein [Paenibacillus sp. JCM 10914]